MSGNSYDRYTMKYIIIVEDDKLLGREIKTALEEHNYEVLWCTTGEEALEQADKRKPDLVYLDIVLPGIHGYQVLETLKNSEKTKQTPIVMLSNLGQIEEVEKALSLGASDYIVKATIDLDKLVEMTKEKYLGY